MSIEGSAGIGGGGSSGGGDECTSTDILQIVGNEHLENIESAISNVATEDNQVIANNSLISIDTKTPDLITGRVPVDGSGVTQPISVLSLPLPDGSATASKQDELRGVQGTGASYDTPIGGSGIFGWLSGIFKTNTDISAKLPTSLGVKTAANSLPVTLSSDGVFSTNFGATSDASATTDDGTFSHISLLKRLLSKLTVGLPLLNGGTTVSPSNPLPVGGKSIIKVVTITRPSDTTAYAVNDAISNSTTDPTLLDFTNCANANGGQGYIVKARVVTDLKTCTARLRLSLYHTTVSAVNDNAVKPSLFTSKDKSIGHIDFDALSTEDATTSTSAFSLSTTILPYVCESSNTSIYAILSTLDTFTPANGQQFYIEITCELS